MSDRVWEDQISINPAYDGPPPVLPPVAGLADRASWSINPGELKLPEPLEYYIQTDTLPIPMTEDREGYFGNRHFEYWLSGLETAWFLSEMARTHGSQRRRFVEMGSATGRVLRHIAVQRWFDEVWGLDINSRHVAWMQAHLGDSVRAVQNTSVPYLPLEDRSVDCLAAMSVFTHIEHFETAWLAEIRRVLSPDGIAVLTFVTEHQFRVMTPDWPMYPAFTKHPHWTDDAAGRVERIGKVVYRWHASHSYRSNTVYSRKHLRLMLGHFFEILEYRSEFPIYQDMLVLRRR